MKFALTILIFLSIVSCNKNDSNKLIGSWKNKDLVDVKVAGANVNQKITFYKNDTAVVEFFRNNEKVDTYNFKYKFNTKAKIINLFNGEAISMKLKVLKLNNSEMELLNPNMENPMRYERIK